MSRYLLRIQYDGTDFNGWQRQAKGETVQGLLEETLSTVLQTGISLYGAGRTDSGVHAEDQAAHFDYSGKLEEKELIYRLNRMLPASVAIKTLGPVSESFHARFSAAYRQYRYQIILKPKPLSRLYCWQPDREIDPGRMQRCLNAIHGEHSFENFARKTPELSHMRCKILKTELVRVGDDEIHIRIQANRFLRNMVRLLIGSMVQVASGKMRFEEFEHLLNGEPVDIKFRAAPAKGLVLEKVVY